MKQARLDHQILASGLCIPPAPLKGAAGMAAICSSGESGS